jgi:hypothetical protein
LTPRSLAAWVQDPALDTPVRIDGAVLLFPGPGTPPLEIEYRNLPWQPEADFGALRQEWIDRHPGVINGPKLGICRMARQSGGSVRVTLRSTDWAEVQAWQAVLDEHHRSEQSLASEPLVFPPSLAVSHVLLETSDGRLVTTRRSSRLRYHPLATSVSYEEGVEPADRDGAESVFVRCARRGLEEELLSDPTQATGCSWTLGPLILEWDLWNPAVIVIGRSPFSYDWIAGQLPSDRQELADDPLRSLPADLDVLSERLVEPVSAAVSGASDAWHPTSRVRLLSYLIHRFGVDTVRGALARRLGPR